MRYAILMIVLTFLTAVSVPGQILPKKFWNLLQENRMVYAVPDGYASTPVKENGDVLYDFAVRSKTTKMEVRYRIWPVQHLARTANDMAESMLLTMALNISNGKMVEPNQFPPSSVKQEFGADKGFTVMVPVDSEFGEGYRYCLLNVIHKDNVADAYTFYLYDDPNVLVREMSKMSLFHALTFH